MSLTRRICGLTTLAWLVASPALATPAPLPYKVPPEPVYTPTAAQEAQITKGEIVVNYETHAPIPIYYLDVWGAIDAPADAAWKAITTYDKYQEFLPLVRDSGIRKKTPGHCWQYVNMRAPWPLHDHWMVNANVEDKANGYLRWTMADSNLRYERGYWRITPLGPNRCKLQYHLAVDPWLDIVPNWLVEFATKQVLPNVIKGVRKRVKEE